MMKELKTSQLIEYKKLLKTVLDGIDSAIEIRKSLIDFDSANKYQYALYDSFQDPEPYYHIKLFDKAIGIVRLYTKQVQFTDDPEQKNFHFAIRCYNFDPSKDFNLPVKATLDYKTYGDFPDIIHTLPYFFEFEHQLEDKVSEEITVKYKEIF